MTSLAGPKILLMGPGGTGKTYSLGTAVDWAAAHGREVFYLATGLELESLLGYWTDKSKEVPACLHWHEQLTKPVGFADLKAAVDNVAKLTYEGITKLIDPNRAKNNAALKIIESCSDFPDDRTGKKFGPLDEWDDKRIFIMDSMTETANAFMKMVIGSKPTASQPDYGVAQNNFMNFIRLLTQATKCTVILTAHIDRQLDPISGGTKISVKSIGQAIASDIGPLFSEVILTAREADRFYWDTAAFGADTKTRSLGYQSKISPDFAQILDKWLKRAEGK